MKLDAWMEQGHSLDENLRLIESLSQAVNEVHDRGEAFGGLQPDRIEVEAGDRCDLSEAKGGTPSPDYAPPDGEGDSAADVYAVGKMAWEILAGRSAGESPQHLSEVRPDISKELADAIMACLERSADWRPKDLTFLAQMAAARQGAARSSQRARGATRTSRRTPARRTRSREQGRRTWPLLAALVVVLGLGAFAWRQFAPGGFPWPTTSSAQPTPPPVTPPVTEPASPGDVPSSPADTPTVPPTTETAADVGDTTPAAAVPPPAPPPSEPEPTSLPEPEAVTRTAPVANPAPAVAPPPVRTAPSESPVTSRPAPPPPTTPPPAAAPPPRTAPEPSRPAPAPSAETETAAPSAPPEPAPPATPAVLTAVSPLEVKRPGKILVDLRGQGFLDQHAVRILPVKKAPRGISVVRQKRVNDTLITVLIELTEDAETGEYAFAVEDGLGQRTDPVIFTVTK